MFDVPIDSIAAWVGLALAGVVLVGVALALPTATPPDAAAAADTVDAVAASPHAATADHPLHGATVRLDSRRLTLVRSGARAHATFAYGPVTPVTPGTRLARVLAGRPAEAVFESARSLARATAAARERAPVVSTAADRLLVRHVRWRGVDVTLVGA
ncbi:hypothetical protein ACFQPA_08965 [Halomarina halobia]|uniref:Uncharacterized protein n=1 Tax=Halomarina halobia TaxID=3033386 RepID=A0ABD6AB25_9EURY|nr:hypothetical protein [Halomarina sp. PSR21]